MKNQKIYFYGIKGRGMSALAILFSKNNFLVRGCDYENYFFTEDNLRDLNITIDNIEGNINLDDFDIVVIGNSFQNKKIMLKKNQKLLKYNEALAYFAKSFAGDTVAVTGTHGKTTTTKMLSDVLNNVTSLIGDGSAKFGPVNKNAFFIYEACEYRKTFLHYEPEYLLINNIEFDHADYYQNIDEIIDAFHTLAKQTKKAIILNADDKYSQVLYKKMSDTLKNKVIKFGFTNQSDFQGSNLIINQSIQFNLKTANEKVKINLSFSGMHNAYNALASIVIYYLQNNNLKFINEQFSNFTFPKRRFNEYILNSNIIIDDYAHHPTALKHLITTSRVKYLNKKVYLLFEPSYFSRTKALAKEFAKIFELPDYTYLSPIYSPIGEVKLDIKAEDLIIKNNHAKMLEEMDFKTFAKSKNTVFLIAGSGNKQVDLVNKLKELLS